MFTVKLIKRSGDTYDLHVDGNPSGVLDPGHVKMVDPVVELEENTAGTFSFSLPYGNAGNTNSDFTIDPGSDEIALYQKNENGTDVEIWRGFFLESKGDFWKSGEYECLGELAYLGDSLQEATTYTYDSNTTNYPELYLTALINIHNEKMTTLGATNKLFTVGRVTVSADNTAAHIVKYVNTTKFTTSASDNTFDCIKQLISSCGGHLEVRRENGTRYLDYLKDYSTSDQSIDFGTNLIDYEHSLDLTNLVTVLYPYGESETVTDETTGTTSRVARNISSVNNGRKYITLDDVFPNEGLMAKYGVREGTVVFSNVTTIENIYNLGVKYLQNIYEMLSEEIIACKAVDMAYTNTENGETNVPPIRFLQKVKVTSRPHGLVNKYFPVTKMSIPLSAPENAVYTMAIGATGITQLSTAVTDHGKEQDKIEETIEELGGGGGEGKETPETIIGKDPSDDWVIGKVTIGKEASVSAGEEFMPHADHLKLFYDRNGSSEFMPSTQPQCYFVRSVDPDTGNNVIVINGEVVANYSVTGFHPYAYGVTHYDIQGSVIEHIWPYHTEQAFGAWAPSYISEELVDYDDLESHTVEGIAYGIAYYSDNKAFAGLCDGLKMKIYWTGPTNRTYVNQGPNQHYLPMASATITPRAIDMVCSLHYSRTMYWKNLLYCPDAKYHDDPHDIYFNSPIAKSRTDITNTSERIKVKSNTDDSRYTDSKVFGSWASGIMPMAERPLFEGALDSLVVYCVCDFVFGEKDGEYLPGLSTDAGTNSLSIYHPPISVPSSDESAAAFSYDRLCNYSRSVSSPATYKPVALYSIEKVASQSESASDPFFIRPRGHMYAYAWMRNVGAGEKYPFTSELTGGLAVAVSNGAVYTGQVKWTTEYNNRCSQNSVEWKQAAHMSQVPRPSSSNPKKQYLVINHALRPYTASSADYATDVDGNRFFYADPYNTNNPRLGGFGSPLPPGTGGDKEPSLWRSSMAVNAIGYAHAAYNQITMDEVVDNLNYLISKYSK